MLFPVDIRSVGVVTPFGINNNEAVSKIFMPSETLDYDPNHSLEKLQIRDYLSSYQQNMAFIRYMDIISKKAIIATHGSLSAAGFSDDDIHKETYRFGVVMTISKGPCATRKKLFKTLKDRKQQSVSATLFSNCGYNIAPSLVAGFFGLRGANLTVAGDPHAALSSIERSSVLLKKGYLDYVLVGYADSDPASRPVSQRISMVDFSCIFLIAKAQSCNRISPSFRLETVDETVVRKKYLYKGPLKSGRVYGIPKDSDKTGQKTFLKELNLQVNTAIREERCYLTFLHLAFLWGSVQHRLAWKFWILPIESYRGITCLKVSHY